MIAFRNIAHLNQSIIDNLYKVPRDIQLIVGVPRSGLLAANLVSLYLNLPFIDLDSYLAGRFFRSGFSRRLPPSSGSEAAISKILILDDSCASGSTMAMVRQLIADFRPAHDVVYGVVYIKPGSESAVDLFFESCPVPRIFEWNMMHHELLRNACIDIDGVLCRDPLPEENDDGPRYEKFLKACEPLFIPTVPIGCLVTCRLEKYRDLTEDWLKRRGVSYDKLFMMHYPDKAARIASGDHARFKAAIYTETNADLFIESDLAQSLVIADMAGKQVICMETRDMVYPSCMALSAKIAVKIPGVLRRRARLALSAFGRWIMHLAR